MAPATWLQGYGIRYGPVKVKQGFFSFLLFLATLAAALLFGWLGWLRNRIFWGIR